jgi:hypothetical protein
VVAAGVSAVFAQPAAVPAKWLGSWTLDVGRSSFGEVIAPGVPAGLKFVSQTLTLSQTGGAITFSADSVLSDSSRPQHEENSVKLDGTETVVCPAALSFKRVDDSTFEILGKADFGGSRLDDTSEFVFSPDGKTLTETKTQTIEGAVNKTSRSVLVFAK